MAEWQTLGLPSTGGPDQITVQTATARRTRHLLVALPPGYDQETANYPVVYMHDGQNLFDPATSFAGDWGLVASLNALASQGVRPIVVGIPNRGGKRRYEYSPFQDRKHGGGGGERYLSFLVEVVKPLIDGSFRTRTGPSQTVIAGSSLGGLISLYALYRHPGIFGAASLQSPALWFADRAVFRYLATQRFPAGPIHLDVGTAEGEETLGDVRRLRDWLMGAGYVIGTNLSYVEEAGAGHDEVAWGRRFRAALPFLLGLEPGAP
jgi:predicted alpha/beta superfamily hydrolase